MLVLLSVLIFWNIFLAFAQRCTPPEGAPNCVCETAQGTIDLRPLYNEGSPKFKDILDSNGQAYLFNPCIGISGDEQCGDQTSAVCQRDSNGHYRSCGLISTEEFYTEAGGNFLQYSGGVEGRISVINLICDESKKEPELLALGDGDKTLTYKFDLRSKCACPNGCQYPSQSDKSGSIGISFIIIFIVGLMTYFVVGALVLKFKYQKKGYDLIPQRSFWFALPGLVKEGFIFTFHPFVLFIKRKMGKDTEGTEKQDLLSSSM